MNENLIGRLLVNVLSLIRGASVVCCPCAHGWASRLLFPRISPGLSTRALVNFIPSVTSTFTT